MNVKPGGKVYMAVGHLLVLFTQTKNVAGDGGGKVRLGSPDLASGVPALDRKSSMAAYRVRSLPYSWAQKQQADSKNLKALWAGMPKTNWFQQIWKEKAYIRRCREPFFPWFWVRIVIYSVLVCATGGEKFSDFVSKKLREGENTGASAIRDVTGGGKYIYKSCCTRWTYEMCHVIFDFSSEFHLKIFGCQAGG